MTTSTNHIAPGRSNGFAYLCLTLTMFMWGCNAVFGRLAVGEISPMVLVSLRWLGTFLLLFIFAQHHVRREWHILRPRLVYLSAMGALGYAGFNAMFYFSAHSTTAVNIGIIQGAIPVFVLIGAFAVYRTPVSRPQMAGVMLTLLGVVILASGGEFARLAALALNHGDGLMILASALYAGYTVGLRERPPAGLLALFTVMAAAAFLASVPLVIAEAALGTFQPPATVKAWTLVGLVVLLPSFMAQMFFIKGVELIGPGRAGVFVNLIPVFASILGVAFLGEPFEIHHAMALALVLVGIWLSERGNMNQVITSS